MKNTALKLWLIRLLKSKFTRKYFGTLDGFSFLNHADFPDLEPEMLLIPFLVNTGSGTFFDIGSNKGEYLYMANKDLKSTQIIGFEPNPWLFKKLRIFFPKIRILNCAVSNSIGTVNLEIPVINQQEDDALAHITGAGKFSEAGTKILQVQTTTLDEFCQHQLKGEKIDLIKIDVEGAEFMVLEGAKQTINRHHPALIVELEPKHHGKSLEDLVKTIENTGYSCYFFSHTKTALFPFETYENFPTRPDGKTAINTFLFLHKESELSVSEINQKITGAKNGKQNK